MKTDVTAIWLADFVFKMAATRVGLSYSICVVSENHNKIPFIKV